MDRNLITKGLPQHEDFAAPELLDVSFEIKEVSEDGTFSGYGSTFGNVDLGRDVMAKGAFTKALKKKNLRDIKLLWQHDARQPIGVWEEMREDDKGLFVRGRLLREVRQAEEAYVLMKAGAIGAMSIGFSIPPDGYEIDEKKRVRVIKEADLWEVSVVTFAMNPKAKIRRVKSVIPFQDLPLADRGRPWSADSAEKRVRQWAGGGSSVADMDWGKYRQAFLWYDDDNAENVTSYKLPVADIVGGELTAIPRGIFAAAGVLLGARGGVDLPENARSRVISHVERYYSKMDMESPFKMVDMGDSAKNYNVARLTAALDAKEYEQTLREVGFSGSEAKAITAKIGPQREVEASGLAAAIKAANETLTNL
jgi:hypothetical protein